MTTDAIANHKTEATQSPISKDSATVKNTSELSELIRNSRQLVEKEPDLKKAIQQIREEIVKNPKLDRELANSINKATQEAEKLQTIGKERLVQALKNAEGMLLKQEQQTTKSAPTESQSISVKDTQPMKLSEVVKNINVEVSKNPSLNQSIEKVREQIVDNQSLPKELSEKVKLALTTASSLAKQGRVTVGKEVLSQTLTGVQNTLEQIEGKGNQQIKSDQNSKQIASEIVKNVKVEVQQEPNLQKAVEKVRDQVVNNPKIDREVTQKVDQAVKETVQLQQLGRESVGRERLQQALTKAEVELRSIESRQQISPTQPVQSERTAQDRDAIKQIQNLIKTEPDTTKITQKVQEFITNNKSIDPETAQNLDRLAKQAHQLDQAGRQRLTNMLQQVESTLQQELEQASNTSVKQTEIQPNQTKTTNATSESITAKQPLPSESITKALKVLQTEPNLEEALTQVRKELTSNPNIDLKTVNQAENSLNSAQQLLDKGREMAARQQLTNELKSVGQELIQTEPKVATESKAVQNAMQYDLNEQLQALGLQSKDILVTKVTQQLAQATHDFREIKREMTRNLDQAERIINNFKQHAYPHAKQGLEDVISKLDKTILKSDMMLFTDMRTEKQLLQASTQLAEAKKLLSQGNHAEASKIVRDVKNMMDSINFKPSDQKIVHYVKGENEALQHRSPTGQLLTKMSDATYQGSEPSAKSDV